MNVAIEETLLQDLEALKEAKCEGGHLGSQCTEQAIGVWAGHCGDRKLACQGLRGYHETRGKGGFWCIECGVVTTREEALKGWVLT